MGLGASESVLRKQLNLMEIPWYVIGSLDDCMPDLPIELDNTKMSVPMRNVGAILDLGPVFAFHEEK